jgi:hypothetical protein
MNDEFESETESLRSQDGDGEFGFWTRMFLGECDIPEEQIWRAYADNLSIVLPEVSRLLDEFIGRTVVTSDHGNLLGYRCWPVPYREWGHPKGLYTDRLVEVPGLPMRVVSIRRY